MTEKLIIAILLAAFLQPSRSMQAVAAVLALTILASWATTPTMGDYECYWGGAAFDAVIMVLVVELRHTTISTPIIILSVVSMFSNFYELLVFQFATNPAIFPNFGFAYYSLALAILVTGGLDAIRRRKVYDYLPWVPGANPAYGCHGYQIQREAKK